ncbi:MAG: HAMP domain-containing sensor histidine kinase [Polyangiaceae bacterium]|jgi:two-component system sensor histidine kinase HydH
MGSSRLGPALLGAPTSQPSRAVAVFSADRLTEMSDRRYRRWSWWAGKGALAMGALAALALAVTVLFAQQALSSAADVVIRGDADTLVSGVVVDLWQSESLSSETLVSVLGRHEARRLRYVGLIDRQDHHVLAEAGTPSIATASYMPGETLRQGPSVRLVALIPPRAETRAAAGAPQGPTLLQPYPRPYLVVEFDPPVIERLHGVLLRIAVVAVVAALVLVAFAVAWSRATARLSAVQRQVESERRLVALGRASSVIAHELRNPLAGLKGHAQLLVEDLAEPSRSKAARVVMGAERLEGLLSTLLDFVRDGPLDARDTAPSEIVARALADLPRERIYVDLSLAPAISHVDAERTALALRNLVQNAVQATPDQAEPVEVRVATQGHNLVFEVRDHGPGLAPGAEAQIFHPFMTTKTRGIGLGLSIARRIAEQHHGSLTGETHCGGGALFRLVLPAPRPESP